MVALSQTQQSVVARLSQLHRFEKPLAALLLSVGLTVASLSHASARTVAPFMDNAVQTTAANTLTVSQTIPDGVYVYGQSPEAMQIGSEYLVFEVTQDSVVGAFYMPSSSFDCFVGEVNGRRLALNVINSYDQSSHPYSIALASDTSVASNGSSGAEIMGLEGFHRLSEVSELDQELLNTCRASHL